jgi:bifunctional DNA-binding transcriptional regulator/antitoxin component of YhaV-PrlF toxin-antitoxin module
MSGTTFTALISDRGRLVVPQELRERAGLFPGRKVVLIETPHGILLTTREQLRDLVRRDLQGKQLVDCLLADRRAEVATETAERV